MKKYRTRVTFIFALIISFSVLAAGFFMAELLSAAHLRTLQENLLREARLLSATVDWSRLSDDEGSKREYGRLVQKLKDFADARVTYIRKDGKVLADSDLEADQMENHADRQEIVEAASHGVGYAIRYSETIGQNMMYVALSIGQAHDPNQGFLRLAVSLESVESSISRLWYTLGIGLLIILVVAIGVIYRSSSAMTRPIERMTRVAHEISGMNYNVRVPVKSDDEIGQLSRAINLMADSLQIQMNRIQENERRLQSVLENMISGVLMIAPDRRIVLVNRAAEEMLGFTSDVLQSMPFDEADLPDELVRWIRQCIESRESVQGELSYRNKEERNLEVHAISLTDVQGEWFGVLLVLHDITAIRRLERMRSEFVANVSHELKTPIASVKGFAETLMGGALEDKETARSFLQIIYDESDRLDRLIGDLMELSKIESKKVPLHFSPIRLQEFLEGIVNVMRPAAGKKQIRLNLRVDEDLYIEADEDRLRQIVLNLLSNGISYTPEGGTVTTEVERIGDKENYEKIRLTISDNGIGIPEKDLPRIFERFYRVDKARSRSSGGTGLGLSIVKHLVELHHGSIRVESKVGLGSRFIIELPAVQDEVK